MDSLLPRRQQGVDGRSAARPRQLESALHAAPATPILQRGPAGSWDGLLVADAKVIPPWEGRTALAPVLRRPVGRGVGQVGLADEHRRRLVHEDRLEPGRSRRSSGAWDDGTIQGFSVRVGPELGLFRAWYVARRRAGTRAAGTPATSGRRTASPGRAAPRTPCSRASPATTSRTRSTRTATATATASSTASTTSRDPAAPRQGGSVARVPRAGARTRPASAPAPPPPPPPAPAPPPPPAARAGHHDGGLQVASSGDDGDLERGDAAYRRRSASRGTAARVRPCWCDARTRRPPTSR